MLATTEETCDVVGGSTVPYLPQFPSPRVERVLPGHLVAIVTPSSGAPMVVWRWFDAVVLADDELVTMWEPAHGVVRATRRTDRRYVVGTRAYLSAGLPGADWWVAGPVVAPDEPADVELVELREFLAAIGF